MDYWGEYDGEKKIFVGFIVIYRGACIGFKTFLNSK